VNDDVKLWLPRAVAAMRRSALIAAGLSLLGGAAVCAVTWFLLLVAIMPMGFLFGSIFTHTGWFAFAGLLILFVVNATVDRQRLQRVEVTGDHAVHVIL